MFSTLISIDEFFYQKHDVVTPHCNLWGDFNLSLNGTLELNVADQIYLSPPNYGLWIPPQTEHCCTAVNEHLTHYICIRIHPKLCQSFAQLTQTLNVRPFLRQTITEILEQQKQRCSDPEYYEQLLQLLFRQIQKSTHYQHYLPQSNHPILKPILDRLSETQHFHLSLQEILDQVQISERHALRLSQQQLQMSLSEWRNRSKIIYAISQIQQGVSIKKIGLELGYQHSSSFIEFFKRFTGQTPAQMRHQ
ncbi:AraC family transcriptional regulator [Acinetobacter sp. TY1]|uniref:AraC family transcriptional regulator n=1 Tax=unclassified Acinetobacter TaxID=196816 RepID=UPI0030332334